MKTTDFLKRMFLLGTLSFALCACNDDNEEVILPPNYDNAQVGDLFLEDGFLLKPDDKDFATQKDKAIGVVAFLYKDHAAKIGIANALQEKGVDTPHGLVMALKNAAAEAKWGPQQVDAGYVSASLKTAYESGQDGYVISAALSQKEEYPAFKEIAVFAQKVKTPEKTTGWYIPSIGEWIDIMSTKGIGNMAIVDSEIMNSDKGYAYLSQQSQDATDHLNAHFKDLDPANVDLFSNENKYYWSSTESSKISAYVIGFLKYDLSMDFDNYGKEQDTDTILRCVFAF